MSRSVAVKRGSSRFKFIGETIAELKKVVWLTRREIIYLTTLVLIVSIAVGIFLGVLDYGFTKLVNDIFLGSF
ncbi:preprotein translocase subunit SecE [Chloroflexota bacterium]